MEPLTKEMTHWLSDELWPTLTSYPWLVGQPVWSDEGLKVRRETLGHFQKRLFILVRFHLLKHGRFSDSRCPKTWSSHGVRTVRTKTPNQHLVSRLPSLLSPLPSLRSLSSPPKSQINILRLAVLHARRVT